MKLLKVKDISNLSVLKFIYKCKIGDVPEIFRNFFTERKEIHNYDTRNNDKYELPKINKYSYGGRTLKYIGAKMYNEVSNNVNINSEISAKELGKRLKMYFIQNYCQ